MYYEQLLFPAHAGVILEVRTKLHITYPFPRPCGGDPGTGQGAQLVGGFSPPMRG